MGKKLEGRFSAWNKKGRMDHRGIGPDLSVSSIVLDQ